MRFTGERFVAGQAIGDIEIEHLQRYQAAADLVIDKQVLDAACGEGYGSYILAAKAKSVIGIDIAQEAVSYAKEHYIKDNLHYECASIAKLPLADQSIDVVVSFETIEHVSFDVQQEFLQEIKRVLKTDGILLMSSPDKRIYSDMRNFHNQYHIHEFYEQEFVDFLDKYFKNISFYRQGIDDKRVGVIEPLMDKENIDNVRLMRPLAMSEQAMQYILAVCSNQKLPLDLSDKLVSVMPFKQKQPVRLFIDSGSGFNEDETISGEVTSEDNWSLAKFSLADFTDICGLRFDPIEKAGGYCQVEYIESDGRNITVVPNNAFAKAVGIKELFLNIDPQYLITGDFQGMTYLILKYKFTVLSMEDFAALWQEKYDIQRSTGEALLAQAEQRVTEQEKAISEQEKVISELNENVKGLLADKIGLENYLQEIKASRGYRLLQKYYDLRDVCLPRGSSRRLLVKNFIKGILNITRLSSFCTKDNFAKVMAEIRKGNFRQLLIKIDSKLNSAAVAELLENDNIKYGNDWLKTPDKFSASVAVVDIIVPIYNAFEFTEKCVESVYKNTTAAYDLYLIDDCSTDARIKLWLEQLQQADKPAFLRNLYIIENTENLGFIKSVNKGIGQGKNNIVLLNTDTEVPPNWLERLIAPVLRDARVASVTPFSNCATVCSFPKFCSDNELPKGMSVAAVDAVFADYGGSDVIELPTGVGFCMLLNRECLDKIGDFDTVYGKGYAEENDWCRRAVANGYKNVMVTNLFVYHKHGVSFAEHKDKAKEARISENLAILSKRYPDYSALVDKFVVQDVGRLQREFLAVVIDARLFGDKDGVMFINHSLGGGTKVYQDKLINEWRETKRLYSIELQADGRSLLFTDYNAAERRSCYFDLSGLTIELFNNLLRGLAIKLIYINQLVTYPAEQIINLIESSGVEYIYFVHDYYAACPRYTLINEHEQYCYAEQDAVICNACLAAGKLRINQDIVNWRLGFAKFLRGAKQIIAPSQCTADILNKYYPELVITVREHDIPLGIYPTYKPAFSLNKVLNIALIGAIGDVKGAKILYELVDKIRAEHLPINLKVIGITNLHNRPYKSTDGVLEITGQYEQSQVSALLAKWQIGAVLIPSIWPETYSYTTSEAIFSGYPIVVFAIGAPAQRVKQLNCGWVVDDIDSDAVISLFKQLLNNRQEIIARSNKI